MKGNHKRMGRVLLSVLSVAMLATACSKNDKPAPDEPINIVPKVSEAGTSMGTRVTKVIGASGGFVTSADHAVTVTVPSGALGANTTIGIEPITNTNVGGKGTAYRLTPHGQQFAKPVEIAISYLNFKDSMTFPLSATLSFQSNDGIWRMPSGSTVDTSAKVVKYSSTHFSDWAIMERVSLKPVAATLGEGEKLTIQALIYNALPNPCNCLEDLLAPLVPSDNPYPVGDPSPLPSKYIKNWKLVGPGSINRTTGNNVEYKAPASIPSFTTATVVAQLNGDDQGKYLLLSNIKLASESWIEMSIGGGAARIHEATPAVRTGDRYLFSGGNDEAGEYIGMKWVGGLGTHGFDLANTTSWHFNSPAQNYVSMYIPAPDEELRPSGGGITITKLEGGWIEGTFNVAQAGYGNFVTRTTANGKFRARLITQ